MQAGIKADNSDLMLSHTSRPLKPHPQDPFGMGQQMGEGCLSVTIQAKCEFEIQTEQPAAAAAVVVVVVVVVVLWLPPPTILFPPLSVGVALAHLRPTWRCRGRSVASVNEAEVDGTGDVFSFPALSNEDGLLGVSKPLPKQLWEAKVQSLASRPKSCEVPGIK
ncbi:hypothetical protein CRUP_032676 [Coryphaenoides rupestris]|nr:hypothetical protein CRUP_032676 [Coryphaenoides rupestris]